MGIYLNGRNFVPMNYINSISAKTDVISSSFDILSGFVNEVHDEVSGKVLLDGVPAVSVNVSWVSPAQYKEILESQEGADNNTIYIVSSLYLNALGNRVLSVAPGISSMDAVNYSQLSSLSSEFVQVSTDFVNVSSDLTSLSSNFNVVSSNVSSIITGDNIFSGQNTFQDIVAHTLSAKEFENDNSNYTVFDDDDKIFIKSSDDGRLYEVEFGTLTAQLMDIIRNELTVF